ncbi:hypothetical protein G432_09295 [Sphingomonas sp. MM-1]|uniref:MerR family transcriptional regulator n=1 Tax=Sphingomonas sp. MM-1 TaxID=745310 RepID=UPI0002C0F259|nr:MerR family transcriptional regulator [Sphingomonas sp. MM-1]AGH49584.1 hypothetical protein G432_09295 [Sphingomonas sp. MM-1]
MNQLTVPRVRFRHAAAAVGVTKKTLRNWLVRGQVQIETESEGWNEFSLIDLAELTLTAELVRYGVGILPASMAARSQISLSTHLLASYKNTPAQAFMFAFRGARLFMQSPRAGLTHFKHARDNEGAPADWAGASLLTIDIQTLIEEMLDRLAAAMGADDGADEGDE